MERESLESLLDKLFFFCDVAFGINMKDFVSEEKDLGSIFIPVASYHDELAKNSNEETVAMIEGVIYPWFGVSYRIDRIQYSPDDIKMLGRIDQSKEAIAHAQNIANLFVDESRLSSN